MDPQTRKCRGGPAGLWGCLNRCRPWNRELPAGRGLSPVALTVPGFPGPPTDPARALALAWWAWQAPAAGEADLEPGLPLVIS